MPKMGKKDQPSSKLDKHKSSKPELVSKSEQNVKILKNVDSSKFQSLFFTWI